MSIKDLIGLSPKSAIETYHDEADKARRRVSSERVNFFQDNFEHAVRNQVYNLFTSEEVRNRVFPFIKMACATSVFRRIIDETCRHTYTPPPNRIVKGTQAAKAYKAFVDEVRLDRRFDVGCRLLEACNALAILPRYSESLGRFVLDLITPDVMSVIPHPDDPRTEAAFFYDVPVKTRYGNSTNYVFWDDTEVVYFNENLQELKREANPYGRLPAVFVHKRERWGDYWDTESGGDLVATQLAVALLTALSMKLLKSQGEKQIVVTGDAAGFSEDQVLDSEGALVVPSEANVFTLDLRSDARHYGDVISAMVSRTAANYGVSADRLQSNAPITATDTNLLERRQETIRVWEDAELRLFDLMKVMSQVHPDASRHVAENATMQIHFREVENRLSEVDQLKLWQEELKFGLTTIEDIILSRYPALSTDKEALEQLDRNLESYAQWVDQRRKLNAPADPLNPGKAPADNGRGSGVPGELQGNENGKNSDEGPDAS